MCLNHDLVGKMPDDRQGIRRTTTSADRTATASRQSWVVQTQSAVAPRVVRRLLPGTVSGLLGLGVGCLAGVFVPGAAYRVVTIVVASLAALVIGWRLDRMTAALRRPAERPQN